MSVNCKVSGGRTSHDLIRSYTVTHAVVLDAAASSGTDMFECKYGNGKELRCPNIFIVNTVIIIIPGAGKSGVLNEILKP